MSIEMILSPVWMKKNGVKSITDFGIVDGFDSEGRPYEFHKLTGEMRRSFLQWIFRKPRRGFQQRIDKTMLISQTDPTLFILTRLDLTVRGVNGNGQPHT